MNKMQFGLPHIVRGPLLIARHVRKNRADILPGFFRKWTPHHGFCNPGNSILPGIRFHEIFSHEFIFLLTVHFQKENLQIRPRNGWSKNQTKRQCLFQKPKQHLKCDPFWRTGVNAPFSQFLFQRIQLIRHQTQPENAPQTSVVFFHPLFAPTPAVFRLQPNQL